jgi:hypothetical protein
VARLYSAEAVADGYLEAYRSVIGTRGTMQEERCASA